MLDVEKFRYWLQKKNAGLWDLVVLFEENGFKKKNPERYKEISEENLNYYCELFGVIKDALLFKPNEIKNPTQQSLF